MSKKKVTPNKPDLYVCPCGWAGKELAKIQKKVDGWDTRYKGCPCCQRPSFSINEIKAPVEITDVIEQALSLYLERREETNESI